MMAAGKSTVGSELAPTAEWQYVDNDELVQRATGRSTPAVLATGDEPALRRVEAAALDATLAADPPVIAGVAAGMITDPDARRRMREAAFVVNLRAPISLLAERVGDGCAVRSGRPRTGIEGVSAHRVPGAPFRTWSVAELLRMTSR